MGLIDTCGKVVPHTSLVEIVATGFTKRSIKRKFKPLMKNVSSLLKILDFLNVAAVRKGTVKTMNDPS